MDDGASIHNLLIRPHLDSSQGDEQGLIYYSLFKRALKGENESVTKYEVKFTRLSRYGKQLVANEKDRVQMFTWGLKPSIRQCIVSVPLDTYIQCIDIAKTIEAEAKDYRERKDAKVGKRDSPKLSQSHMAQGDGKRRQTSSSISFGCALRRFMARSAERCLPFFKAIRKAKDFAWTEFCQKSFEELKTYLSSPPLLSKPLPGEDLFMYLSVTEVAVSAILVREENGVQRPIYYVSKVLQNVEMRYPKIDKMALALITSTRRLRPYFSVSYNYGFNGSTIKKSLAEPRAIRKTSEFVGRIRGV
ncbi:hypothetical protein RJ639_006011 [Escallonia herrerae]|uniref:Reverse transcriptase/retrotransposon-derived protein RNase H-like domain-containing protein n=1 Tax=Escallonia herrerae TaxID=1293975 RepID=A0AA88VX61_9ASTE|nr:hypothetical protein RJ639_006011 [Escallonia herrerae]